MDDHIMKDSSTYQLIIRRGEIKQAWRMLLRQGAIKFGQPADAAIQSQIESIADPERIDALIDRIPFVSSWADLPAEA